MRSKFEDTMEPTVIQRIIEIWGLPRADMESGHDENPDVIVGAVWILLAEEFGVDVARTEIQRYLVAQGQRELDESLGPDDMFLTRCCFQLAKSVDELALDVATTRALLWSFPPVGYHREVELWAARHFEQAQLLDVLAEGIRSARNDMMRACCVQGLAMYFYEVARSVDDVLCPAVSRFEASLRTLIPASDILVKETTNAALKIMWKLHEKRPCEKLDQRQLTAYRIEDGASVHFVVERRTDGYGVLQIQRFEVVGETLVVEYFNNEPSLLPSDVPAVLEAVMLPAHLPDGVSNALSSERFVDLRLGRTIERLTPSR